MSTRSGQVAAEVSCAHSMGNIKTERFNGKAMEEDFRCVGLGSGLGEGLRGSQPPCGLGLGDAFQLSQRRFCGCFVGILSTRGECSLDVWRSRSIPSWPSCRGLSGVACFYALFCRMR